MRGDKYTVPGTCLAIAIPILALLATSARSDQGEVIPPGTYVAERGKERILVGPEREIVFQIHMSGLESDPLTDTSFEYTVLPDGTINFLPITSIDYGKYRGKGRFEWVWRDGKIARADSQTRDVVLWFVRQE